MKLEAQIEGVLFYKTEPVQKVFLADFFDVNAEDLEAAFLGLTQSLQDRGLALLSTDTTVQLVTDPELAELIDTLRTDELSRDIGKAGAETLAIILYRGPLTRGEIDRIRGVNSTFIIRNLLVRGLVERRTNPADSRSFLYAITPALLQHLGIEKREDLPEFETIMNSIDRFESEQKEEELKANDNPFNA